MSFTRPRFEVFAQNHETGEIALNVNGLPVRLFAAMTKEINEYLGTDDALMRNATDADGLGPGAWYVFSNPKEPTEEKPA